MAEDRVGAAIHGLVQAGRQGAIRRWQGGGIARAEILNLWNE